MAIKTTLNYSPNFNSKKRKPSQIKFIIFHYTGMKSEKEAVEKLDGVTYFNLGTDQVPTQATVDEFLQIMDDSSNYPVLLHCYHGVGRAQMFSAIYRIEYEGWSNQDAREKTRLLLKGSSFDEGKPKGDYLINYKPRANK